MAEIYQDTIIITVSKLVKKDVTQDSLVDEALFGQIEAVIQEMLGDDTVIVEVGR